MSFDEDSEINQSKDEVISVKKSAFNGLVIGLIILVGSTAFFGRIIHVKPKLRPGFNKRS